MHSTKLITIPSMLGVIYLIRNRVNGKVYVGQTRHGLKKRWREHVRSAMSGGGYRLHRAIREHGLNEFSAEIIDTGESDAELDQKETTYIARYNSCDALHGYNMEPEASVCRSNSPESRAKKSAKLKGRIFSASTLAKMSAAKKGKPRQVSDAARETSKKRMQGSGNHMYGVAMPEGHQDKLQAAAGRWRADNQALHKQYVTRASIGSWANLTPEQKEKRIAPMRSARWKAGVDRTFPLERRLALAERLKGAGNPFFGKKHSDATKAKIAAARRAEAQRRKDLLAEKGGHAIGIAS